jgi:putative transposase
MLQISFTPNQAIKLLGQNYVVESVIDEHTLVLRSDSGTTRTYDIETLFKHSIAGNLRASRVSRERVSKRDPVRKVARRLLSDASPKAQADAKIHYEYLKAISDSELPFKQGCAALKKVIEGVTAHLGLAASPSFSTLTRWRNRAAIHGGDPSALIPRYERRGGPGKARLRPEVVKVMDSVIDNYYLTTEVRSAHVAHEELIAQLAESNQWRTDSTKLSIPSYSSFLRHIRRRGRYEVLAARHGANAAERIFRSSNQTIEKFAFNECWEMDHTVLDVIVVDKATGLSLGRPRITIAIEYVTRAIVGFDIGFGGMSSQAVLNCLRHGITPKTYLKEKYPDVKGTWPCHGYPSILKVDNGMEFHSSALSDACFELGIELQFCPVRSPWFKGRVERRFGILNLNALTSMPGATGTDLQRRKDLEKGNLPVIDLELMNTLLHIWIVDINLTSNSRGVK